MTEIGAHQGDGKERGSDDGRREAQGDFASGAAGPGQSGASGLHLDGDERQAAGDDGFGDPDLEPDEVEGVTSGKPGGGERGASDEDHSPAGDGSEDGGALHGLADEVEVGGGEMVLGERFGGLVGDEMLAVVNTRAESARAVRGHRLKIDGRRGCVKCFAVQSIAQ